MPVVILNSPAVVGRIHDGHTLPAFGTSRDIAGVVIWALGWVIETVSDAQKVDTTLLRQGLSEILSIVSFYQYRFKSSRPPKDQPCTVDQVYFDFLARMLMCFFI
jgi:hypothetical protein